MFDLDKWEEIWLTMMQHKLRTALTSFGVFWGIFMLVILLGAGNGLQNGAMQNFDIAKNAVFVWTMPTTVPFAGFDAGRQIEMNHEDTEALSRLAEVKTISPRLRVANRFSGQAISIVRGDQSVAFTIMGDYPEFLEIKPYIIEEGRFINQLDIDESRKVAVIGLRVREELFNAGEQVIAMASQVRVWLDKKHDIQITPPAARPALTPALETDLESLSDSLRDVDADAFPGRERHLGPATLQGSLETDSQGGLGVEASRAATPTSARFLSPTSEKAVKDPPEITGRT